MNFRPISYFLFLVILIVFISCKKSDQESFKIELADTNIHLKIGEKRELKLKNNLDEDILNNLEWTSARPEIATVNQKGVVSALESGVVEIRVKYQSSIDKCTIRVGDYEGVPTEPLDLSPLEQPFSAITVYSKDIQLIAPYRVVQSFDLDKEGNIYYSQIGRASGWKQGKTKAHEVYIIKGKPNEKVGANYMTLKFSGHAANIAIEESGGDKYVWISTNATKKSSGEYWDAKSVSRIKYEQGKVYEKGYGGTSFFLNNGIFNVQAAIDKQGNFLCILATKSGTRYLYTYKLSDAMNLPDEDFVVTATVGGEEVGTSEHEVSRVVQGKDLSKLTPLGSFSLPPGKYKEHDVNSYHLQGFDIDGPFIYFNEGDGTDVRKDGIPSHAYVTVFNLQGKIVVPRTNVAAINDVDALVNAGITNGSGYMEAEGIKIKGNKIYLQYASHQETEDYRRANIFRIQSQRK